MMYNKRLFYFEENKFDDEQDREDQVLRIYRSDFSTEDIKFFDFVYERLKNAWTRSSTFYRPGKNDYQRVFHWRERARNDILREGEFIHIKYEKAKTENFLPETKQATGL
jgi:hypothetical protein